MKAKSYLWSHLPTSYGLDRKSDWAFCYNLFFSSIQEFLCHLDPIEEAFEHIIPWNIILNLFYLNTLTSFIWSKVDEVVIFPSSNHIAYVEHALVPLCAPMGVLVLK